MKRVAIILIPIFLLISIGITVYVVLTQRMEIRKKAQEAAYTTDYGPKNYWLKDWCDSGPYVEISAIGTSYDPATGVQILNLKARRVVSDSATPTATPAIPTVVPSATPTIAPTPTPAPYTVHGIIFEDCLTNGQLDLGERKVDVENECGGDGTEVWNTSITLTGPGIVSGQFFGDPSIWGGNYLTEPVPTPGQQYTVSLNLKSACIWKQSCPGTALNCPVTLTVPQQGVRNDFGVKKADWDRGVHTCLTGTPTPSPTGAVQGVAKEVNAAVDYRVPLDQALVFKTLDEGCIGASSTPNSCLVCTAESPGFFRVPVEHTILVNQTELDFTMSITKPATERLCGCSELVGHIWDVNYPDSLANLSQVDCNTVISDLTHSVHDYLYAVGSAANCVAVSPTVTPLATTIPTPSATPTVGVQNTPTPNKIPLCTGLSASPTTGTAPLTVHLVGSGTDPDGPIMKFEFNYGDGKTQQIEKDVGETGSVEIDHTYTTAGQFVATFRILDNNGIWSAPDDKCTVTIVTSRASQTYVPAAGQPNYVPPATATPRATAVPTVTPTPTTARVAQGPTLTPTPTTVLRATSTISSPTRTPTPTRVASASATVVVPQVPKSGGILPTLAIGVIGVLVLAFGLLFAL